MVLIELLAYMADILSYYQDRIANEAFLSTAQERRSVIEHLRLIGYEMPGAAPANMEALAQKLRAADGFVFVCGEYNWGMQPGLKNLVDHFGNPEWGGRPAGILSYSAGRMAGARSSSAWHPTLSSLGMAVVPSTVAVGTISASLDETGAPTGEGGAAPGTAAGQSLARFFANRDTNDNAADFGLLDVPTPGAGPVAAPEPHASLALAFALCGLSALRRRS